MKHDYAKQTELQVEEWERNKNLRKAAEFSVLIAVIGLAVGLIRFFDWGLILCSSSVMSC